MWVWKPRSGLKQLYSNNFTNLSWFSPRVASGLSKVQVRVLSESRILDKFRHTLKMSRILDTFWEVVKDHRFVVLMQKSSDFFQYNYDLVTFSVSQLFYNLDWEINGEKCTCLTMQSDFIVQKMSRNMAKMKMCELYRHEKVKE